MPHAVSRLRAARLARSTKPFLARGGFRRERCAGCRLVPSHCLCALRPSVPTRAGVCLLMADVEPLKPSNTGWLIADVVPDTWAFQWSRTEVEPDLLALLADTENIRMEPSALAGMAGPPRIVAADGYQLDHGLQAKMADAAHLVWGTGGAMVPDAEKNAYYSRGKSTEAK